jgi:hypothetical protein
MTSHAAAAPPPEGLGCCPQRSIESSTGTLINPDTAMMM